ncbi:aldehyde dehydrogenase (NADP(+)) [Ramlibacter sp. AW1]|uniref:Aldehyde dehydrogenase (NADP(+)) n=1 Tax=Ramlibacter aurantiacus TaxID=2801330 RepID=A0A936ZFT8_9BURK|nr:aldehyde dehydrogenase (NADP(+)) [Ramlibacter aurantiacus]MBL0419102.1 aldehyde dehydrogenase (NADP(+)) [Ramlibacter aurantiacus]
MNFTDSTAADVDAAARAAHAAFATYGSSPAATRAALLRSLADALQARRESLVKLADEETHLGTARLDGELDRTAFQLRGFANQVEQGAAFVFTDDPAVPGAPPAGHPHLMRVRVPLGPVAMFSASNFPFAFSVLGGDTASALAAGCPVVVKAHRGHRALSHAVAELARQVVKALGLPAGVFDLVDGRGSEVGVRLVQHPLIQAAAFTGSVRGGLALQQAAQSRPRPIPFFGELGSVNPFVVLPPALGQGAGLAQGLAVSITTGCGQFCTSPGVIVVPTGAAGDAFVEQLAQALHAARPHAMLTTQMREGFEAGRAAWAAHPRLQALVAEASAPDEPPRAFLAQVDAAGFVADPALHEEVFGPAALVVRSEGVPQVVEVLEAIGGSLTVTLLGAEQATDETLRLVRAATQVAGRVLFKGVPTGVAVTAGQQHGGPFPSSTQPATTSVGWAAMDRFLRPVALQDAPAWLVARQGQPC